MPSLNVRCFAPNCILISFQQHVSDRNTMDLTKQRLISGSSLSVSAGRRDELITISGVIEVKPGATSDAITSTCRTSDHCLSSSSANFIVHLGPVVYTKFSPSIISRHEPESYNHRVKRTAGPINLRTWVSWTYRIRTVSSFIYCVV